jgi:hypothetical protein
MTSDVFKVGDTSVGDAVHDVVPAESVCSTPNTPAPGKVDASGSVRLYDASNAGDWSVMPNVRAGFCKTAEFRVGEPLHVVVPVGFDCNTPYSVASGSDAGSVAV